MKVVPARSRGVNETVAAPATEIPTDADVAFDELYRRDRDDVHAYVAGLLRDRSAAEDVTALAFERAYRRRRSFNPKRGTRRAWLFGIARNAALDELRKRKRSAALVSEPEAVAQEPEEELDHALRRAAVQTAMATLPTRDRELIALKFHAGLDNAELAAVLGVSVTNAGTRLHRVLTQLREVLDDQS